MPSEAFAQRTRAANPGFFAFEPPNDPFTADALLDLRSLNEKRAGEHGFLRRDGMNIVAGDGKPIRLWAINVGPGALGQGRESLDYLARKLAKLGVNMVRFHGPIADFNTGEVDTAKLDQLFYMVAALKREGIYTELSFYFPVWFKANGQSGLVGYDNFGNKNPFAILYFEPRLQARYRGWAKALLDTKNPYTNKTLAQDPAVGIVEIINEDSLFFYTFSKKNIPMSQMRKLELLFGKWLIKQYGSLDNAFRTWQGTKLPSDDVTMSAAGLYDAWDMTRNGLKVGGAAKVVRVGAQVKFLTEMQRDFYAAMAKYFRDELHVGGMICASNWIVADPVTLDALERYTYTPGDVMDRHGYFGGKHDGEGSSYSVRVGHIYEDLPAVLHPEGLPIQTMQIDGFPQIISEIGWPNPNRYRADATFLASAYGALQGVDGVFFFAVRNNYMRDPGMEKFAVSCPVISATLPATAMLYRRGDIAEAETAVHQVVKLDDLYAMKGSGQSTAEALDELRKRDIPDNAVAPGEVRNFDPLAYYVGRVVRAFGDDPNKSFQKDLSKFIDRDKKIIRSLNNQLNWDYGTGVVRVNTPRTQGTAGFLGKAGKIELGNVMIECGNEYASILITSLDDAPLSQSKKILIQAMTEEEPFGFKAVGGRIQNMGGAPLGVKRISAKVTIKLEGEGEPAVVALDENGYARNDPVKVDRAGPLTITLAEDSVYHVIRR